MLENFDLTRNKPIIFAADFNLFLDRSLETKGGNPYLKKQLLSKLLHIKEKLNLCDIWRILNPKAKQYTFRQQPFSVFLQRHLDYIFISQSLQEIAKHTAILNAISTSHSPVLCSFQNFNQCQRGPGLWKSLVCNEEYILRLKELINKVKGELNRSNQFCAQVKWEVLKYEIRCFTIKFSKDLAKAKKSKQYFLENKLKFLESNLNCDINSAEYINCKNQLEEIYANGMKRVKNQPSFF